MSTIEHCKPHPAIFASQINDKLKGWRKRFTVCPCLYDLINDWTTEFSYIWTVLKLTLHITRMVWVIAFSSPDSLVISSISLCDQNYFHLLKFRYRDKSCYRDKVNRAAGLRAVVMVFASSSWQFYHCVTNSYHLPGLSHLDNFIVTRKSCPLTGTLQKRMPTPTRTATNPHHRAVSTNLSFCRKEF